MTFTLHYPTGAELPGTITGEASGAWSTAPDGILLASADDNAVVVTVTIGGKPHPGESFGWNALPIAVSHYNCSDGEVELTFNLVSGSHPVKLVPAT